MAKRSLNPIPKELRQYWMIKENAELGLEFDSLSAGSNKKAWWNINGIKKLVMIKSVVNNRERMPEPIPQEYLKHWHKEKNDKLGINFNEFTKSSHKECWWIFKGKEQFLSVDSAIRNNPLDVKNPIPVDYKEFWVEELNSENRMFFEEMTKNSTAEAYWYYKGEIIKLKITQALNGKIKTRLKHKLQSHPSRNYLPEKYSLDWNEEMNKELLNIEIDDITIGSDLKVYWYCDKHISYLQRVADHTNGKGCPYCSASIIHPFDSVWSRSELMAQWSENNDIEPYKLSYKSKKLCRWIDLEKGEEFEQRVINRYEGRKPQGYNRADLPMEFSLGSLKPEWLKEWDYVKNIELGLDPYMIGVKSNVKVYWKCLENPEHPSYMRSPAGRGKIKDFSNPCPICKDGLVKSKLSSREKALKYK